MILSILTPTLVTRRHFYKQLEASLLNQGFDPDKVQLLKLEDNREKSIGEKRNILRSMAEGEYSVFIDDDDKVPAYYIDSILAAIEEKPDVIGLSGQLYVNNRPSKMFVNTLECNEYSEDRRFYYRCPNHLNPMKTDLAKKVDFQHSNFGEDTDWALKINDLKLLQTEIYIEKPMYYYYFVPKKFY